MNSADYDKLWNDCIKPSIDIICDKNKELKMRDGSYETICRLYNDIRRKTKRQYMEHDLKSILDRHKIASCMANAILLSQPLTMRTDKDYADDEKYFEISNEILAFTVGLSILKSFIELKTKKSADESMSNYVEYEKISTNDFVFPPSKMGEYYELVCWAWHHNFLDGRFDILGTANLFFMIENYSLLHYKLQVS